MKNLFSKINQLVTLLLFLPFFMHSQAWSWESGSYNGQSQLPVYGTQGISSPTVTPGNISECLSWTDNTGNFWLYGGYAANTASWDDLWKYNSITHEWTWIYGQGISGQAPVYGTLAVPSSSSHPGSRRGSATWTDNAGNLWLYGGENFISGTCCDLWKYNISTNQWTWVGGLANTNGNHAGVFGTQGTPSSNTRPGTIISPISWTDSNGDFWLFGGLGSTISSNFGQLNDLWKYTVSSGQWAWMKGSANINQPGNYGTQGVSSSGNIPPARSACAGWVSSSGDLYMFGGIITPTNGSYYGYYNDFWKYTISTGNWTWVGGSNIFDQHGVYGAQNIPSASNVPGGRTSAYCWKENNGDFWMFGGSGLGSANGPSYLNDLWKYSSAAGNWTWVKGSNSTNAIGLYGTQGIPAQANTPSARTLGSAWSDLSGNLWLFSGIGSTPLMCDMWKFTTCLTSHTVTDNTPSANLSLCGNLNATVVASSSSTSINWFSSPTSGVAIFSGDTLISPPLMAINNSSVYTFYAEASSCPSGTLRTAVSVTVLPAPVLILVSSSQQICLGESDTLTVSGGINYNWSTFATGQSIVVSPLVTSTYMVSSIATNGCSGNAAATVSVNCTVGISSLIANETIRIYPNPVEDYLTIEAPDNGSSLEFKLFDYKGALIKSGEIIQPDHSIVVNDLSSGLYLLRLYSNSESITTKKIIIK